MSRARRSGSIRRSLWAGMGAVGLLLALGGLVGWWSVRRESAAVADTLDRLEREVHLTLGLSTGIAQELLSAQQYLEGDKEARTTFDRLGFEVRRSYRELDRLAGRTAEDAALVGGIMRNVADAEAQYAVAHRLADLGRLDAARARAAAAGPRTEAALAALAGMGAVEQRAIAAAAAQLAADARQRLWLQLALLAGALLLAAYIARRTVEAVVQPLTASVVHARRLRDGDLTARSAAERLPAEFAVLAQALNGATEGLAKVATVVAQTAKHVAGSADSLASGSQEIAASASQVATAMVGVAEGAEQQVAELREVETVLTEIGGSARELRAGAGEVERFADAIRHSAEEKRAEVTAAGDALKGMRDSVFAAASDLDALREATNEIRRFVGLVSAIATQSKLLALNAAIEAARAGEQGRGFGVVAEEVGKLTAQTQDAAGEIIRITELVTGRIDAATRSMTAGVGRAGDIERLSGALDAALAAMATAADGTRETAGRVALVAECNAGAVEAAKRGISGLQAAAEQYAAAAGEVSASSEEQSASCQEVSSTATELMVSSTRLEEAVAHFNLGRPGAAPSPANPAASELVPA